jgi:hypothetical protein
VGGGGGGARRGPGGGPPPRGGRRRRGRPPPHRRGGGPPPRGPAAGGAADDVLDAAICAWVADGAALGEPLIRYPDPPSQSDLRHVGRDLAICARALPDSGPELRRA